MKPEIRPPKAFRFAAVFAYVLLLPSCQTLIPARMVPMVLSGDLKPFGNSELIKTEKYGPFYLHEWDLMELNRPALSDPTFDKKVSVQVKEGPLPLAVVTFLMECGICSTFLVGRVFQPTVEIHSNDRTIREILEQLARDYGLLFIAQRTETGEFHMLLIKDTGIVKGNVRGR